jgi:hypothetical protein
MAGVCPSTVTPWIFPRRASSRSSQAFMDHLSREAGRPAGSGRGGEEHGFVLRQCSGMSPETGLP